MEQWLFIALGLGGALIAAKGIGDFAFDSVQDLSRSFQIQRRLQIQGKPRSAEPVRRNPSSPTSEIRKRVVVAVVDTGVDERNGSLKKNLWINPGESGLDERGRPKESNMIDDDNNGFVDDVHGWNFAAQSNDLDDSLGHGTHVA
ncbi:MAG: hypothetical protein C5B49_09235, partial [Bdellovibrio sp.]